METFPEYSFRTVSENGFHQTGCPRKETSVLLRKHLNARLTIH
jgi:hypothetical protein